eukprot:scaffold305467_cov71-Attheya_sp.AAC.3
MVHSFEEEMTQSQTDSQRQVSVPDNAQYGALSGLCMMALALSSPSFPLSKAVPCFWAEPTFFVKTLSEMHDMENGLMRGGGNMF